MARQYIGRTISGGVMALCLVLLLTPQTHSQSVGYRTYTISGNAGAPDVVMQGLVNADGSKVTSDQSGDYRAAVRHGWRGAARPTKGGWTFPPKVKSSTR